MKKWLKDAKSQKNVKKVLGPLYQFNADAKMPRNGTFLTYDRGFYFVLDPPLSHGGTALKVPGSSPVDPPPQDFFKSYDISIFLSDQTSPVDPPPKFFFQKL